ncbi:two-component system response regulator YesN [Metabacillus crassostreae]|uniref:response regulator transcription factor n=1 Tax=Metabacillus crassostreae TaxID=929098 RepID=UPI001956EFF4|nr:response regulator [Metabacillus crassostreae]MBM7604189.1 two-component system response regulator YesN [Metabacillus crassostreae]
MYKLLIVDDEKNIRLGIQAMINREFTDLFSTLVASDGQDALNMMKDNEIDILITDIKMPGMNGIALIQHIKEDGKNPALIILSGYDDFEYAREAIKWKVKDYLLKPINRKELFQTLTKVVEEIESDTKIEYGHHDDYRATQLNNILLNPKIGEEEIESNCRKVNITEFPNGYYIGLIKSKTAVGGKECHNSIKHIIEKQYCDDIKRFIIFCDKDENVVLISPTTEVFDCLKDTFAEEKYIKYLLSVSEKQNELKNIKVAYNQALIACKYHFLFPRSSLIFFENISSKPADEEIPINTIHKISNMIGTDREKELKVSLLTIFDFEKISQLSISYMESLSEDFNSNVFDYYFNKLGKESFEIFKFYKDVGNIYNYENFFEYFNVVEELVMKLHEYVKQIKSVYSEQKYMEKALGYINENYNKDLNLAVVSNYISLNYSYFSHTFKEYTGLNFVDYLKKIRINEAKKLLVETELKVLEISEMVGYKNPKQFTRVFREIEGVSPKEFRS